MKGSYEIGFFDQCQHADGSPFQESTHWHKLDILNEEINGKSKKPSEQMAHNLYKLNVVNDFSLFNAIKSNIAYLCTENVEGYSLNNVNLLELIECIDAQMIG